MTISRSFVPPLYALTDAQGRGLEPGAVDGIFESGARWVQLRFESPADLDLYRRAEAVAACLPATVKLFIRHRVDIALAVGADGVHLCDGDLPPAAVRAVAGERPLIIGVSTHSVDEAIRAAAEEDVDYVAIGPIFRSRTKSAHDLLGADAIRSIRAATEKPLVAMGGINQSNIREVLDAGADSAAVIAALYEGDSVVESVRRLLEAAGREG